MKLMPFSRWLGFKKWTQCIFMMKN
jgi:hypothetical protein